MKKNNYPERSCIACRKKDDKKNLFKIVENDGVELYDREQKLEGRSRYLCKTKECLLKISKNKKINISAELLYGLSKDLKEEKSDLISVLNFLRRSSKLCFGYEMTKESLKKGAVSLLLTARDMNEKNKEDIESFAKELKVNSFTFSDSSKLGDIFSKEKVGVIGIIDKKAAIGFAKKLGGEQSDS